MGDCRRLFFFILLAYANSMQAEIGPGYKTKYDIIVGGGGGGRQ